jgi:Pyridoxamine 5'-phosphate oxidase
MADKLEIVRNFMDSVSAGAPQAELLSDNAVFRALNFNIPGKQAVLKRLTDEGTSKVYKTVTWQPPFADTFDGIQIKGTLASGAGGVIMTMLFEGDKISAVQQQNVPGASRAPSEMKLTPTIKSFVTEALATKHPMVVAYTDEAGQPVLSYRGSTQAFSDDQIAMWVRNAGGSFLKSIQKNPKIALMYRNEESKATYQFQGRAKIATDEATREKVYQTMTQVERDHDYARTGVALVIDLDMVQGQAGLGNTGPIEPVRLVRSK